MYMPVNIAKSSRSGEILISLATTAFQQTHATATPITPCTSLRAGAHMMMRGLISGLIFEALARSEVVPGFGTTGLSGGAGCSVMVDGADDEENETEVRCRREGEDSA